MDGFFTRSARLPASEPARLADHRRHGPARRLLLGTRPVPDDRPSEADHGCRAECRVASGVSGRERIAGRLGVACFAARRLTGRVPGRLTGRVGGPFTGGRGRSDNQRTGGCR